MTKEESKLQMHEAFEEEYLRGYKQGFKDRAKQSDLEHITCANCYHNSTCEMQYVLLEGVTNPNFLKDFGCNKWETR